MRIYCTPKFIAKDRIIIADKAQLHHISKVMRLKKGARLSVFDGKHKEYDCVIDGLSKGKAILTIIKSKKLTDKRGFSLTLACSIPKKVKMAHIIEKVTELGVDRVIPLKTERTIVELSQEKAANRVARWQKIASEASQQCGRVRLPTVEPLAAFGDAVRKAKDYDLAFIFHLGSGNKTLKEVMSGFKGSSAIAFIGPEGDFTEKEVWLAEKYGCVSASLGDLVLKVDTAAVAITAILCL